MAFYYYEPKIEERPSHAVYAYCASQCDKGESWKSIGFGELVREVELELTPAGKPRLLITTDSTLYTGGKDYYYGACDVDCTQHAAWSFTNFFSGKVPATVLVNDDELHQHAFELDPSGWPRFVVYDENQAVTPNHFGLFYLACDEQCDQKERWRETLISTVTWEPLFSTERISHPSLAFTPDGKPRIASAEFFPIGDGEASLVYFACDEGCDNSANWNKAQLMPRGFGAEPSADIEVDKDGRPRIAFYQEALLEGKGKRLFYLSCNDSCFDPGNWSKLDLGLGTRNGQEPDLELDSLGRPRIAYADWNQGGIGIAWCDANCDAASTQWQGKLLEDRRVLHRAWPVAYPPHCDGGMWNSLTPNLVLPANGQPHIAFDADYHAHCLYDDILTDALPPISKMHLIKRAARVISVAGFGSELSITLDKTSITVGQSAVLTWSASNVTACSANGAWSGPKPTAGSETISPAAAGTHTYTLVCNGATGSATGAAALSVAPADGRTPPADGGATPPPTGGNPPPTGGHPQPVGGGGGGGGCTMNPNAGFDPVLPLLLLAGLGYVARRRAI